MAARCPTCSSSNVTHNIGDLIQCLTCGQLFNSKGDTVERGPDATTRAVMEARLAPRTTHVVGNFADLQRVGAEKAPDPKEPAFQLPAGVDAADVKATEKADNNQVSAVVAEMSRTDVEPADEQVDAAKALQAKAAQDRAADVASARKKVK